MWARAWSWLTAGQQLVLWPAVMSMVLFAVVTIPADLREQPGSRRPVIWVVSGVVYAVLVLAGRRFPLSTVAVAVAGSVALMADGNAYPFTLPAVFCVLYSIATESGPVRTLAVGVSVKAVLLTASLVTHPGLTGFVVVLWAALTVTTGSAARIQHSLVSEAEERARRAEQVREEEAERRVAEERLRIARELHDAVGHHVALITVQAGALSCLLDDEDGQRAGDQAGDEARDQARRSVAHIQRAGAEALEDLRLTVGLLRQPGSGPGGGPDQERAGPAEPVPGLDQIDDLIRSFTGAGLRIAHEVTGQARPLPEAVGLTAYRVVQESLTNTRKHAGCTTVVVRLGYGPGVLSLAVEDEGDPTAVPAPRGTEGHGLVGMRERVAALGGRLAAGPGPAGGYRVLAELPLRPVGGDVP